VDWAIFHARAMLIVFTQGDYIHTMLDRHPEIFQKYQARLKFIQSQIFRERALLKPFELAYTSYSNRNQAYWQTLPYESYWGEWVKDFLIRTEYQIPETWSPGDTIALYLPFGTGGDFEHPEALIYVDEQAFTTVDRNHQLLVLPEHLKNHDAHQLILDGWTGIGQTLRGNNQPKLYLRPCYVVRIDDATYELALQIRTALEVAQQLEKDSPAQVKLITILEKTLNRVDTRDPIGDAFYASVPGALNFIRDSILDVTEPADVLIHAAGHAHIDTAWLWRVAQTRRKTHRTFYTALHLMERYRDYYFSQSQPQLYEFVQQDDPQLFDRIRAAVDVGRWEPLGGMWVEADCNVTGAESYVRQFLYGRRYFRDHFGEDAESPVLWLPDTFGYPATIPQMAKEAGIEYFFTTKLRWNEHNDFPYDTFYWEGLDGTRILSHITPTPGNSFGIATYNAEGNAQSLMETWQRMKMKHLQQMALMSYGWGDGGGGPTPEMLENLYMLREYPGMPRVKQGRVLDFYHELEEHVGELPVWNGELYLETHQGTLTSQAWIKKANRKTEVGLHDVEYLSVQAMMLDDSFFYPQDELERIWKILLLNQFHDILPGSSIKEVYDDAKPQFEELANMLTALKDMALRSIAKAYGGDWIVVNTVDFWRNPIVYIPERLPHNKHYLTITGEVCRSQDIENGTLLQLPYEIQPFTIEPLTLGDSEYAAPQSRVDGHTSYLENELIRVEFNEDGDITRISDTELNRDLLAEGAIGNQFQIFEDRPLHYDAWNIDPEYTQRMWLAEPCKIELTEWGPIRATVKITRKIMSSTITQHISVYANSPFVEFRTHVDWRERNMLLKVAFPVSVTARNARYHIQWGSVERPTHRSTEWDAAKYEVAAHHWADLGGAEQGVTLVNDCKYAYDIQDNVMRLTLLKSPVYPDPTADLGEHEFTYRLYSRRDNLNWQAGYDLNYPLLVQRSIHEPAQDRDKQFEETDYELIIETIKRSEDGNGIIFRAYSIASHTKSFNMTLARTIKRAWRVNFLEEKVAEITKVVNRAISFDVRPFEIISICVEFED